MAKSILAPMIAGYLAQVRGFDRASDRPFVAKESARIAAKIRERFSHPAGEANEDSCAWMIRAFMENPKEPESKLWSNTIPEWARKYKLRS
jgi:hypothetical protein